MRGLLFPLLVALCGCPPPAAPCERLLVSAAGNVGELSTGGSAGPPPPGLVGSPVRVTVFAPLTACAGDPLRAEVTLLDPDNLPLATLVDSPTLSGSSAARVSVTFTPVRSGTHALRISFEPSLGARSLLIDVATDGLLGSTVRVPIPAGGNCELWPLSDDTVACEERAATVVSVTSSDGGVSRFNGTHLVVAATVLWSIEPQSGTLERRVFEDGGVRITHRFPDFPGLPTPAMHAENLALRFRRNGALTRVRLRDDGGTTVEELALLFQPGVPVAYFADDADVIYRWSDSSCPLADCVELPDVVALEPGIVWRALSDPFMFNPIVSGVQGFTLPTTVRSAPNFTLDSIPERLLAPESAFERLPLWLDPIVGGRKTLVDVREGTPMLSSWPRAQVLRVGLHHVVLTDTAGFVRVVAR